MLLIFENKKGSMVFEKSDELLGVHELDPTTSNVIYDVRPTDMTFLWNVAERMDITVDNIPHQLHQDQIIFLSDFHKIDHVEIKAARLIRFNQPFYCVVNNDKEVGCKGLLFFGAAGIPIVTVDERAKRDFEITWEIFNSEIRKKDILQQDMLQSMLKQMLILAVRILRQSIRINTLDNGQSEIVREFNYLVEKHFAEHHDVAFYASQLNKSPKTLSNIFSVISNRTPSTIIHDRIMMHAKRQIGYTNLSIKEIAYELGYDDIQTFSRFFKNKEGVSPVQYREKHGQAAPR